MLDSPKFWEAFGGDAVDLNVDYSVEDGEEELIIKAVSKTIKHVMSSWKSAARDFH